MINLKAQRQSKSKKVDIPNSSPIKQATIVQAGASQDRIRELAFHLYEMRGSQPGHDTQDRLRAEHQIQGR
jgi:hypothetical protein